MVKEILMVEKDETIEEAVMRMNLKKVGAIVVTEKGKPVGIFTERDILRNVVLQSLQVKHDKVGSVFTPRLVSIDAGSTVKEAAKAMITGGFRHTPVSQAGKLVGMVSARDVLMALADLAP
jgi:CBS domain-containing protein